MKTEEGWKMYIDIKRLKDKGFSNRQVAKMLGISRPTVIKYADMDAEEFENEMKSQQSRLKKPDTYKEEIVTWLKQYPAMTSAQISDWLEERYGVTGFSESTLRSYVRDIREEYNILKDAATRQYEAVDDPPMGRQMQVDFGEKKVIRSDGEETKIYVMCFVLSRSRHKYCEWQGRVFNTADIIRIHENAFEYYGGYPEEAVYDQDHLILVSENHGDLVYTKEFAAYLQKRRFRVYMCRKADPESKGRIEKVVDFVKDNFASNRTFYNIDRWNEDCLKWLKRRGNGKIHGTTRKIPAEVFIEERKHLQPVTDKIITKSCGISITYQVRKDNTIPVQGNRYQLPRGTYKGSGTYVGVNRIDGRLMIISDLEDGKELARYEIPQTKGNLLTNRNHKRDNSEKIPGMIAKISGGFPDAEKANAWMEGIRQGKPRYIRDQLMLIESSLQSEGKESIEKALEYCVKNRLYSAVDFKDALKHYSKMICNTDGSRDTKTPGGIIQAAAGNIPAEVQVRDINEYIKIMNNTTGG